MKVDINALEAIGSHKSQPNQNPCFDAPIPLYVKKDGSNKNQKIKVKLLQDPNRDQPKLQESLSSGVETLPKAIASGASCLNIISSTECLTCRPRNSMA